MKNKKKNKHRQVKAPDSISVVQLRKETFIGDAETPDHLVHEVIDNFLDEIRNGHGKKAELHLNSDGSVWSLDCGRGLPQGKTLVEETGKKHDTLELLFTKLHTGTKFDLDDYNSLFGQNGLGLVLINALSEWVEIFTKDITNTNNIINYRFENGKLVKRNLYKKKQKWSTIIGFKPSNKFFNNIEYSKDVFLDRLQLAQAKLQNSSFVFNKTAVSKNLFEDYVRNKLTLNKKDNLYKIDYSGTLPIEKDGKILEKPANIDIYLTYSNTGGSIITGDVNLRSCGGTYLSSFQTLIKNILPTKLSKKFQNIPEKYLFEGLRLYISLEIPEPKFDSQTKIRMTTKVKKDLIDPLESKLSNILSKRELLDIIEEVLERKVTKTIKSISKSKKISASNKLNDCFNSPGEVLYILEGDSADSTLQVIRDKWDEASLPLRGKVINVENKSLDKITKNKEINDLIEALGPKGNRRYKHIKILADADADGGHIVVLALLIFNKYFQDIIEDKKLSIILPPLYGASKKGKHIPVYNIKDIEKYKNKGYTIRRFKGIGEMNSKELEACIQSKVEYVVNAPNKKEIKKILSLIKNSELKRNMMNNTDNTFEEFIDTVLKKKRKEK